jgi:transposase, IS30 family
MPRRHLSIVEREVMAKMLAERTSLRGIARALGRDPGTVSRERARNAVAGGYFPARAQARADLRRARPRGAYKLDDPDLLETVCARLEADWSPEQIAGRLRREHPGAACRRLSHTAIYALVREDKAWGGSLWTHLRRARRTRRKRYGTGDARGRIPNRVGIEERPPVVEERARLGDWEGDTLEGAKGRGLLAAHVERASAYTVLGKMADKRAATLNAATARAFARHGDLPRETLTVDNGREFAQHEALARRLGLDIYFARPYHAWERGLSENTNGLLRQYLPKGTDFSKVSHARLRTIERRINTRPRKTLQYRTPEEVLQNTIVAFQS